MFISFEGIDGSGKSTQARRLEEHLTNLGNKVSVLREPGGPPLSERIRTLLLSNDEEITPFAELLLFSAARAQLVRETIRPALEAGDIVICDRFFDSTTAYQGAGRNVAELEWLEDFHLHVTGGLVPDRTYLVDVPLEVAFQRRVGRDDGASDRMEAGGDEFYQRVRTAYLELAKRQPERIVVMDGTQFESDLHAAIVRDLEPFLETG